MRKIKDILTAVPIVPPCHSEQQQRFHKIEATPLVKLPMMVMMTDLILAWIGLIGLAVLLGLRKRDHVDTNYTKPNHQESKKHLPIEGRHSITLGLSSINHTHLARLCGLMKIKTCQRTPSSHTRHDYLARQCLI